MSLKRNLFRFSPGLVLLAFFALGVPLSPRTAAQVSSAPATQLSVGVGGAAPDGFSSEPVAPPNGDLVVFTSRATNLVANDVNNLADVFQYSPARGVELISVSEVTGGFTAPSTGAFGATSPAVSNLLPDGSYAIAFTSDSTDLVQNYQLPPPPTSNPRQVYLRIPNANKTILVSRSLNSETTQPAGANQACDDLSITALANPTRYIIAFRSSASNIYQGFAPSPPRKTIFMFTVTVNDGEPVISLREAAASPDQPGGAFSSDLNNPVLSGGGRFVAFTSAASFIPGVDTGGKEQVWVYERPTSRIQLISGSSESTPGNENSFSPSISFQGELVSFLTKATNILPNEGGRTLAVLTNVKTRETRQVNVSANGTPSDGNAHAVKISPGGKLVLFSDNGSNLIEAPVPALITQTYIKHPGSGTISLVSRDASGQPANGNSGGFPPSAEQPAGAKAPLSFGSLGFNSPTVFASFASGAQNLTTVGFSSDSAPNVFRASITPPKPRFTKNVQIEAPPDIVIQSVLSGGRGAKVAIEMQEFDTSSTDSASVSDGVISQASASVRLRYSVEVRKSSGSRRILRTVSRNTTTIRKLTPGRYTVRYRVSKTQGKTVTRSRYSPKLSVEIT